MEEAGNWTAFHTYKLPHMRNRSSNRVDSSHSSLKRDITSSSGTIVLTTEKIDQCIIFKKLSKLRSAATPVTYCACLCSIRLQYNLPCKHILSINENRIPLDTIAKQKLIKIRLGVINFEEEKEEKEDKDELWETNVDKDDDCTVIDAIGDDYKVIRSAGKAHKAVAKSTENASILALASDSIDYQNSLSTKQDRKNLIDFIRNLMKKNRV
ncbi:hypothetical protein EDC96DRAFT_549932 [Choanephora cucurbitarum]|nr:hypothetical protein EDC96DRAFT_549932 [Choanephora cucurbitarum]